MKSTDPGNQRPGGRPDSMVTVRGDVGPTDTLLPFREPSFNFHARGHRVDAHSLVLVCGFAPNGGLRNGRGCAGHEKRGR